MDLSKPTVVEIAIASVDEPTSEDTAAHLRAQGFIAEVYFDEGQPDFVEGENAEFGPSCTVYVSVEFVPSHANVVAVQRQLATLIEGFGGKLDGWQIKLKVPRTPVTRAQLP